jgi:lipoprotein-anchoring transpeptidase ErfK/SrfK
MIRQGVSYFLIACVFVGSVAFALGLWPGIETPAVLNRPILASRLPTLVPSTPTPTLPPEPTPTPAPTPLPTGLLPTLDGAELLRYLPMPSSEWFIVVRRSEQRLYLYHKGSFVKAYMVSTGKPSTITPLGWWRIADKEGISPPDIFGTRWMGWERLNRRTGLYEWYAGSPPFGIHGTNEPEKIGTPVSSGCVRLRNADVEELFDQVTMGTRVLVID